MWRMSIVSTVGITTISFSSRRVTSANSTTMNKLKGWLRMQQLSDTVKFSSVNVRMCDCFSCEFPSKKCFQLLKHTRRAIEVLFLLYKCNMLRNNCLVEECEFFYFFSFSWIFLRWARDGQMVKRLFVQRENKWCGWPMCFLCVSKFESMILLYILRAVETLFMSKDSFLVSGFVLPF